MEQSAKEVVLTYETLYEFMRREKSRAELQQLDPTFFRDVLTYLNEKQQSYDDNLVKNDIFSQSERDKLHIQLANIKKLMKDLYNTRERKIINMAINHSRTGTHIVDAENLLSQEQALFDGLSTILKQHRQGILHRMLEGREPDLLPVMLPMPEKEQIKPKPAPKPAQPSTKNVKFLEPVDQFVGEELETYGPYNADDIASLPAALADILIGQGKAEQA